MNDVVIGLILLVVGVVLVLWGGVAFRVLIALLGATVGFFLGAELVQAQVGGALLDTVWGWVAAIVGALVLGVLAYAWYWLGVVVGVAAMGYVIGISGASALGVRAETPLVVIGVIVAAVLVAIAVLARLPALLLVIVSALSGAGLVVTAVLLLVGRIDRDQLDAGVGAVTPAWPWYVAEVVLFVVGVVFQLRASAARAQNVP